VNNRVSDVEDVIIQGLANQERRKILKIIKLGKNGAIYSDILAELELNSGLLNYLLGNLKGLLRRMFRVVIFCLLLGKKL
jgi:hypothetical protein